MNNTNPDGDGKQEAATAPLLAWSVEIHSMTCIVFANVNNKRRNYEH